MKTTNPLTIICCCVVNKLKLPKQFEWTTDDVLDWISELGFSEYKESFKVNFIDGKKLIKDVFEWHKVFDLYRSEILSMKKG